MKKACVFPLALYLVIAAIVGAVVYRRFPESGPALMAGFIGGLIVWLGVIYLVAIPGRIGEARMIRRAVSGLPPNDGDKFAAIGRLASTGAPVIAPFSRTPAVACKYEIDSHAGEGMATIYSGFAMNPCSIQGRHGTLRLLAYPDLKVKASHIAAKDALQNAKQYIASAKFREATAGKLREAFAEMMALYKDDDGTIRYDQKNAGADGDDLSHADFKEWIVRAGDQVCVIGQYSSQRGGIVYDPKNPLVQVKVEVGEPEVFARRAMRGAVWYFVAGAVFLTLATAGMVAFLASVPLEAAEKMNPQLQVTWPEVRFERWIESRVRTPLREAGMIGSPVVSNDLSAGMAAGRVNDLPVTTAEASRDAEGTTIRVGDDAVVIRLDRRDQPVALRIAGTDIPRDRWSSDLDFQVDSADGPFIPGRIIFVSSNPALPAARATFNAAVR